MLVIRLRRIGKKSQPTYRIVVAEHTAAVQGNFVVDLGFYNPHTKSVSFNKDEATDWMNKGAKPSNTVAKLMEREKVKHQSVVVTKFKKKSKKIEAKKTESIASTAPVTEPKAEEALEKATGSAETSAVTEPAS